MFGNRSGQHRPSKASDPLTGPGTYLFFLGGVMFVLPTYFHQSWIFTSWLGSMEPPIGLALMVVGAALAITGFVRGRVVGTAGSDIQPPVLDPNVVPPPPGPVVGGYSTSVAPTTPPGPGMTAPPPQPVQPAAPASALGAGIDAPPPPLEPLYRPPTSMDDLRPPSDP